MILLALSGGVDSTYALWSQLKTSQERLLVHHVHLANTDGRAQQESIAAEAVVRWLHNHGLRHFDYLESSFDATGWGFVAHDSDILTCLSALLLTKPAHRGIEKIIVPMNKDELAELGETFVANRERRQALGELLSYRRKLEYLFPIATMTKLEIIRDMPSDLFERTWYCRTPRDGSPCHLCHTCRLVDQALRSAMSAIETR